MKHGSPFSIAMWKKTSFCLQGHIGKESRRVLHPSQAVFIWGHRRKVAAIYNENVKELLMLWAEEWTKYIQANLEHQIRRSIFLMLPKPFFFGTKPCYLIETPRRCLKCEMVIVEACALPQNKINRLINQHQQFFIQSFALLIIMNSATQFFQVTTTGDHFQTLVPLPLPFSKLNVALGLVGYRTAMGYGWLPSCASSWYWLCSTLP